VEQHPVFEFGDAQRGIELAQMVHGPLGFVRPAGKGMAGGEDADDQQEARQVPESLLRP